MIGATAAVITALIAITELYLVIPYVQISIEQSPLELDYLFLFSVLGT